jgi:capsular exopolysaccharide synthesis family protein
MGKIVDALKVAHGETADLILRSIEEPEAAAANGKSPLAVTQPKEPPPGRVQPLARVMPEPAKTAAPPEAPAPGAPGHSMRIEPASGFWQTRTLPRPVPDAAPLLSAKTVHANAIEQYRFVRTGIMHHPSAPAAIAVSSPGIGDGKTVTAINLAGSFAQSGDEEILLIDGDLRCSAVHEYLRVPRSPGLGEVLAGKCSLADAIFRVAQLPGLCVLPAGTLEGNPTELLGSARWPSLVKSFRQHFHRLIVDCPPTEAVADFELLAAGCDGVLLVVRPDHTNRVLCWRAIGKTREKLLGTVMNCTTDKQLMKEYMSHYYARQEEKRG